MKSLFAALGLVLLSGCSTVGYYWQSVSGHMQMRGVTWPMCWPTRKPRRL